MSLVVEGFGIVEDSSEWSTVLIIARPLVYLHPMWHRIVALFITLLPLTSASAQSVDIAAFRSFAARPPVLSAEIEPPPFGMTLPEGRYQIRSTGDVIQNHTFQISACREIATTPELQRTLEGQRHIACQVVEIVTTVDRDQCGPLSIEFGGVTFARYTSPVRDATGAAVIDNWYAYFGTGVRRLRILIEERRFIVQEWGIADPNMAVIEAPIRQVRERPTRR